MKKQYILPTIHVKVIELSRMIAVSQTATTYTNAAGDTGHGTTTPTGANQDDNTTPPTEGDAKGGFLDFGFNGEW